jgi:hypothetical protein
VKLIPKISPMITRRMFPARAGKAKCLLEGWIAGSVFAIWGPLRPGRFAR